MSRKTGSRRREGACRTVDFHVQAGEEINLPGTFEYIILSDTLNIAADVQRLLDQLHQVSTSKTRLLINCASAVWRPVYFLAEAVGSP